MIYCNYLQYLSHILCPLCPFFNERTNAFKVISLFTTNIGALDHFVCESITKSCHLSHIESLLSFIDNDVATKGNVSTMAECISPAT